MGTSSERLVSAPQNGACWACKADLFPHEHEHCGECLAYFGCDDGWGDAPRSNNDSTGGE